MTIGCGHVTATLLPVIWIINGTSLTQQEIVNSPLYQLNNPTSPTTLSLTVFSINVTTIQCVVLSTPVTTSTRGTVIVTNGMYICMYIIIDLTLSIMMLQYIIYHIQCSN